jgi:hypothetical protein
MIDRFLRDKGPIDLRGMRAPIVVIPIERWDRPQKRRCDMACWCRRM